MATVHSSKLLFNIVYKILTGNNFDEETQPFLDLTILTSLRNEIVHLKPIQLDIIHGHLRNKFPRIYSRMKTYKIIIKSKEEKNVDWVTLIQTSKVAKWACETAINITYSMSILIPKNDKREFLINLPICIRLVKLQHLGKPQNNIMRK